MTNKEAIFKLIKYRRRFEEDSTIDAEPFDMAIEALQEQKTGKWLTEPIYLGDLYKDYLWCSECQTGLKLRTKYCPFCGAKMEGEKDE